jgi:hypothetical protein
MPEDEFNAFVLFAVDEARAEGVSITATFDDGNQTDRDT